MQDVMSMLKDRRAKAEGKVMRAIKALETAKKELADLLAAERVMADITGESIESKSDGAPLSDRDRLIMNLLNGDATQAISPADLYPIYVEATRDSINLEAFRTAVWRLQKKVIRDAGVSWQVRAANGRYWREPISETDEYEELLG
jgi:hypothetical protein